MIKHLLAHPLTRGLDLDDPRTTRLRRRILREKPFLRKLYQEWYGELAAAVPVGGGLVLELGSGAGFLKDHLPDAVTSEVLPCSGVDVRLDACTLPFASASLKAILMVDVFHHIPDVSQFLSEASRCLRPGGVMVMIEPWVSPWSRLVWGRLHHEPFNPDAGAWRLPKAGPLSGANSALPWMVFERDRGMLARDFPGLRPETVSLGYPFSYLLSGGVSLRSLAPGWSFGPCRAWERLLGSVSGLLACFAFIRVRRN